MVMHIPKDIYVIVNVDDEIAEIESDLSADLDTALEIWTNKSKPSVEHKCGLKLKCAYLNAQD